MTQEEKKRQRKDTIAGIGGSLIGLLAMRLYWQNVAPKMKDVFSDKQIESDALNDVAIVEQQHKEDESATAAIGRIAYEQVTGTQPDDQTKEMLSYATHWLFGIVQGGLFGRLLNNGKNAHPLQGMVFGAALWLLGDETAVPALGLQKGPTAATPAQHINRLGAHLSFGVGTAVGTRLIRKLL